MSKLFEEITVGGVTIKNRIAVAPMGFIHAPDGGVSPEQKAYLVERAKGGFGIVYPSAHTVTDKYESTESSGNFLCNYSQAARLAQAVEQIHQYGAKFAIQLTPGYGRVNVGYPGSTEHVSASDNTVFQYPDFKCRPLTVDEIHELVECMGRAAYFAKNAGADIIEIHAYGGYLIDQFMSKIWNRREDEYGGSLENRMRFFVECTEAVRKAVGPDFPLSVKYTPVHEIPGGRTFEDEGIEIAKIMEGMGFAYMHVDYGCYERWNLAIPGAYQKAGTQVHVAERLRKEGIKMPFLIQGKLNDPDMAERVLESGTADMIALGHQSLADPYWPRKVKNGHVDDIFFCTGCLECQNYPEKIRCMSCAINPRTSMELEYEMKPAKNKYKILVIGGGPGGMNTARLAAEQGHKVELWEKQAHLGGNMNAAGGPDFKFDVRRYSENLQKQVLKSGVTVRMMKTATKDAVDEFAPDAVIVAAGSNPVIPHVPGFDGENVLTAVDLLANKRETGKNVVIVGGGEVGCEAALYLDHMGKNVTVVEMLDSILSAPMAPNARKGLEDLLKASSIKFFTSTALKEIKAGKVLLSEKDGSKELPCDTVVMAVGFKSNHSLADELKAGPYKVFTIGDYNSPRKIWYAVHEGFHVIRLLDDLMEI
jgi:2-enoate reductase